MEQSCMVVDCKVNTLEYAALGGTVAHKLIPRPLLSAQVALKLTAAAPAQFQQHTLFFIGRRQNKNVSVRKAIGIAVHAAVLGDYIFHVQPQNFFKYISRVRCLE
ncbi:hypothetical protein DW724_15170, partial [Butyricicoccus sp. AM27-36]